MFILFLRTLKVSYLVFGRTPDFLERKTPNV